MLITPVDEITPWASPECGGEMQVVAFIELPQAKGPEKGGKRCRPQILKQ
jgi:hypothetical protein